MSALSPSGRDPEFSQAPQAEAVSLTFEQMGLGADLLRGISAYGFKRPSEIQQQVIVPITAGRDVIAQAQPGTGKTLAFCIAILQKIDTSVQETQALILSPTRELAVQIQSYIAALGVHMNVTYRACVGGTKVREEMRLIKETRPHIISGTPGRVLDLMNRRTLLTTHIKTFVLDEADDHLAQGFKDKVDNIRKNLLPTIQIVLAGTALGDSVLRTAATLVIDPVTILAGRHTLVPPTVRQFYANVSDKEDKKFEVLSNANFYEDLRVGSKAIIFCNSGRKVTSLTEKLRAANVVASSTHDGKSKDSDEALQEFQSITGRVLVTTDAIARGLDVKQVSLIINYDMPSPRENYIHRIGRSGRLGRKSITINFVTPKDLNILQDIEQYYSTQISEMPTNIAELV